MATPYTLTLEDIQANENLQGFAAMPGDEVIDGKLKRVFSSEDDALDIGYRLTQEDIDSTPNLQQIEAREGDRVVNGKLKPLEQDSAFKQFMYSFDKPSSASDADYMADYIEQKVPLGMSRRDYLLGLLNPSTLANTLSTKLEIKGNLSDGISGVRTQNPDAIWGEGFMEGNQETKRNMIVRKYERDLIEEYGYGFTEGDSLANTLGSFAGMISSPTSLLPIGSSAIKMTLGSGGLSASYSVMEDLAREGEIDPEKAAIYGAFGGIAGFGLNRIGVGIQKGLLKRKETKSKKAEEKELRESHQIIDKAEQELSRNIEHYGYTPSGALEIIGKNMDDILIPAIAKTGRKLKMPKSKSESKQRLQDAVINDEVVARSKFKLLDELFGSLSTRIGNLSQSVKGRLKKYEWQLGIKTGIGMDKIKPFVNDLASLTPETKTAVTRNLFHGNFDEAIKLMPDEMKTNFNGIRQFLDDLAKESKKAGVVFDELPNYFPRNVKDYDGLLNHFGKKGNSGFQKMLNEFAKKSNKRIDELTPDERALVANQFARGYRSTVDGKPRYTKQREVDLDYVGDEAIAKFYESPEDALALYARNAINNIEKYKFFGRNARKNKGGYLNIQDSIGNIIAKGRKDFIGREDEMADLLQSRFIGGEQQMGKTIGTLRDLGYMGTIANPYSAITQFGDLGNSGALHGFRNTIAAMFSSKDLKLIDAGINDISQEFAEGNIRGTAKWLNTLFDITGFRAVDRLGKETVMNAAFRKAIQLVNTSKGEAAFIKKYTDLYSFDPRLLKNLISDLKAFKTAEKIKKGSGKITDDIKFHAFNELSDVQPINLSEMPQAYLDNPRMRLLYSLKTFTLKQIDVARRNVVQEWAKGNKLQATKNAAALGGYLTTLNLGTKTVKDLLVGRDVNADTLSHDAPWALLGVYGMNEYNLSSFQEDADIISLMGRMAAPSTGIATAPLVVLNEYRKEQGDDLEMYEADYSKLLKDIPGVGPLFYNWFGGGAEKYNDRVFDRSLDL